MKNSFNLVRVIGKKPSVKAIAAEQSDELYLMDYPVGYPTQHGGLPQLGSSKGDQKCSLDVVMLIVM